MDDIEKLERAAIDAHSKLQHVIIQSGQDSYAYQDALKAFYSAQRVLRDASQTRALKKRK